jgi:hypothetical protein
MAEAANLLLSCIKAKKCGAFILERNKFGVPWAYRDEVLGYN